jgi:Gpi18-like mannosyltransferase
MSSAANKNMKKPTGNKPVNNKPVNNKYKSSGKLNSQQPFSLDIIILVTVAAVFIRMILSTIFKSHLDMGMYVMWSDYLASKGCDGFYNFSHVVYGPIFMYMLMLSGKFTSFFHITGVGKEYLVKFWPVLTDFVGGYLIYMIGKKFNKPKLGFVLGVFYALNPAIIVNSSIMGQFDSIPATMLLAVAYLFIIKKPAYAAIMYTIAMLTKPQSIFLIPLVAYLFLFQDIEWKRVISFQYLKSYFLNRFYLLKLIVGFFGVVFTYVITVLPFYVSVPYPVKNPTDPNHDPFLPLAHDMVTRIIDLFMWIKRLTINCSLDDYPYATGNGFNLYTLLKGQTPTYDTAVSPLGISYATLAKIFVLLLCIFVVWILVRMRCSTFSIFLSSYVLGFGFFMFYSRMHERYLMPAIIFAVVCIIWESRMWIPAIVISFCCFLNEYLLYDRGIKIHDYWFPNDYGPGMVIAFILLAAFVYLACYIIIKANSDAKKFKEKKAVRR